MLRIIIDENIAYAKEAFGQFGEVTLLPGNRIYNSELKTADILIVRSVTSVNEDLLRNTPIRFVGTTTIGTDHIDFDYLKENNIAFADAKGCNAYSVAEYVIAALLHLAVKFNFDLKDKSIGIIGVGNIGSKVAAFARALGMKVLLNDPPLQRSGDKRKFVELDKILESDIITLHVPLNKEGIDKTVHLFDEEKLSKINEGSVLINTSRGAVVDNSALLKLLNKKNVFAVLDVWENEPNINTNLLAKVILGTSHIAGYSREGKINGTLMIYNSLCDYLGEKKIFKSDKENDTVYKIDLKNIFSMERNLEELIKKIYDVKKDSELFKEIISMPQSQHKEYFSDLRKNYPIRREFNNYILKLDNEDKTIREILERLRFNVIS